MKTSTPNTLRLYLIRHGETEWSLSGRHTGRTDIALTPSGEDEARELGKHLLDIPFAHVLTSPLKRALQTCELVGLNQTAEIEPDHCRMGLWRLRRTAFCGYPQGAAGLECLSGWLSSR